MKFASLFQPLKINSLMIANRIISAPMNEALNDKRVRCGAGILIAGCGGVNLPNAWFDSEYLFAKAQIQKTRQWLNFMRQGDQRCRWRSCIWAALDAERIQKMCCGDRQMELTPMATG